MTTASLARPLSTELRPLGTVFVTGGASGLGAAVVEAVSAAGGTPAVLDRQPPAGGSAYRAVDLAGREIAVHGQDPPVAPLPGLHECV